jgi:23S rRNA (uridine2552-2'-O)-methyltransferase
LEGTYFIKYNMDDPSLLEILTQAIGQYNKVDVMLSDLSPNVSGIWEIDHERQISLTMKALHLSTKILRKEGNAVFKIFQGSSLKHFLDELKDNFRSVKLSKPPASRQESSELYVICLGFKK